MQWRRLVVSLNFLFSWVKNMRVLLKKHCEAFSIRKLCNRKRETSNSLLNSLAHFYSESRRSIYSQLTVDRQEKKLLTFWSSVVKTFFLFEIWSNEQNKPDFNKMWIRKKKVRKGFKLKETEILKLEVQKFE